MNLFWKKFFGGINSTAKFEKEMSQLGADIQRYIKVEGSAELKEYNELSHVVNSGEFTEKKKTLENRKYKDTEVYRDSRKFNALQNKSDIKLYYTVLQSKELKEFVAFEQTPEYEQLADSKLVNKSEKLMKFKKYSQSKDYKTYARLHNSYIIREFEELKEKVSTPEFKKLNEFWANKDRWQTTPEYKTEVRFNELAKNPDIEFYLNTKPERFSKYRSIEKTFDEQFNWNTLSKSDWDFGYHYQDPALLGDHSYTNEKQANNSGKNISVKNGILNITTKKENAKARAWDTAKGFIEKQYEYTSDVMQSAEKFSQKYGIFQAKIACKGKINHAFWLGADKKLPLVKIFHYDGKCIKVGSVDQAGKSEAKISGINPSGFYVYTLIWTEKEMVWMINNMVVHKATTHMPKEKMYLAFNSFISASQSAQEGTLEVDWVRAYTN